MARALGTPTLQKASGINEERYEEPPTRYESGGGFLMLSIFQLFYMIIPKFQQKQLRHFPKAVFLCLNLGIRYVNRCSRA